MKDPIERQAAMDAVLDRMNVEKYGRNPKPEEILWALEELPSAQPERLTDDDFETIRIHLSAFKESLCNQGRWKEAEDYERLINRFMSFASAQSKAIRPKFVAEDRYIKNYFQTFPHCPKCNYELETGDCYCRVCGCHIDWSEDDE